MAKDKSLKEQNKPYIIGFIVWCLTVYIVCLAAPSDFWDKSQSVFNQIKDKNGIFMALSPIIALIFTGIISSEYKARLIFLRWKYALPGHRVFSDLIKRDARIDIKKLTAKMGKLPRKPSEQNSKWFSIYKSYSHSVIVNQAHKDFLLSRDLCAISFLFATIGSLGIYFAGSNLKWTGGYLLIMASHFVALTIVARNHGNRFACNAIAEYLIDESRQ
jgi:hypothetical protein